MSRTFRTRLRQHVTRAKPLQLGNVLYVCLFAGDPEDGGTEATYSGYARQPIARSDGAWVELEECEQAKEKVTFREGAESSLTERLTHWGLATNVNADIGDTLIVCAPLKRPIMAGPGIAPSVRPILE